MAKSERNTQVFDQVIQAMLDQIDHEELEAGWLTLARSLRDNLDLRPAHAERIVREAVARWGRTVTLSGTWFTALEEVALFSPAGKAAIEAEVRRVWKVAPPAVAVACVHLGERLFGSTGEAAAVLAGREDLEAVLPDLVAFVDVPALGALVAERGTFAAWHTAFSTLDGPGAYESSLALTTSTHSTGSTEAFRAALSWLARKIEAELVSRTALAERREASEEASLIRRPGALLETNRFYRAGLPLACFWVPAARFCAPRQHKSASPSLQHHDLAMQRLDRSQPLAVLEACWSNWAAKLMDRSLRGIHGYRGAPNELIRSLAKMFGSAFGRESCNITNIIIDLDARGHIIRDTINRIKKYNNRYAIRDIARVLIREFGRTFGKYLAHGLSQGPGHIFINTFNDARNRDFVMRYIGDLPSAIIRQWRPVDKYTSLSDLFIELGLDTSAPPLEHQWKKLTENETVAARIAAKPEFWDFIVPFYILGDVETGIQYHDLVTDLWNPLGLPLMMVNLYSAAVGCHAFAGNRHAAFAAFDDAAITPTPQIVSHEGKWSRYPMPTLSCWSLAFIDWLRQHPLSVYQVAFAWEEHAASYTSTRGRLVGPAGALVLAHAAYARLMTGLPLDGPRWQELLDGRDRDDPLVRFAYALYDLTTIRDGPADTAALDALYASPPPELVEILDAAGLLPVHACTVATTRPDPPPSPPPVPGRHKRARR